MTIALQALFIALCLGGARMAAKAEYSAVCLTLLALATAMGLDILIDHTRIGHQLAAMIGA